MLRKKLKGMLSLKTWCLVRVRVSLNRIYCFKMAMIELLLKWIMKHLKRLENRQERVQGLIQMHLLLSSSTKQMRISAVHHVIAGVIPACKWLASIVGVDEVVGKDGTKIDVDVAMGQYPVLSRGPPPLCYKPLSRRLCFKPLSRGIAGAPPILLTGMLRNSKQLNKPTPCDFTRESAQSIERK